MTLAVTLLGEPESQLPIKGGNTPAAGQEDSQLLQHEVQGSAAGESSTKKGTLTNEASYQNNEDSSNPQVECVSPCMLLFRVLV